MSRLTATLALFALIALLPPQAGYGAGSAPLAAKGTANHAALASADKPRTIQATGAAAKRLHTRANIVKAKPSPISSRQSRLPDGNVEFCSGPGHQ